MKNLTVKVLITLIFITGLSAFVSAQSKRSSAKADIRPQANRVEASDNVSIFSAASRDIPVTASDGDGKEKTKNVVENHQIAGDGTLAHSHFFKKGDSVNITADGNGETNLGIKVYDANGNPITKDESRADSSFVAETEGFYTIYISNSGSVSNEYQLRIETF